MADLRVIHTEILAQICKDRARYQVIGEPFDFSQDDENLTLVKGPVDVTLPASQAATELGLPLGAAKVKWVAVADVDGSEGINIRFGAVDADPVLVKPPATSGQYGYMLLTTDADSIYYDNPSTSTSVSATITLGCSES